MTNKIIWGIFFTITALLFGYILLFTKLQPAGDIAEYYGITESILNHGSIELTQQDAQNLSKVLPPAYFTDPQYYIAGKDGNRYPVHFFLYSLLALPVRIILALFQVDLLKTLAITNLAILTITVFWVLKKFLSSSFQKIVFLIILYLSPILSFITWPGPDLFYVCLLLLAVFYFYNKRYLPTVVLTILASWHSQPLIIIALAALANYIISEVLQRKDGRYYLNLTSKSVIAGGFLFILIFIPYILNLGLFGFLTPWTIIQNGWTVLHGFGIQNMSFKKLFEQFFDLNIGIFWYMPLIFISGGFYFIKSVKIDKKELLVFSVLILTAFFYQTNPAWNYGTSGYGPTRHILFVLPFLIYYLTQGLKYNINQVIVLSLIVISQTFTLSLNGYLNPKFVDSLYQSPYATLVLNKYPQLYSPTPEIFVDRTNHTDLDYPSTAIYKQTGQCRKAYILLTDSSYLQKECGYIPEKYKTQLIDTFLQKTPFYRSIRTKEATFWPDPESCSDEFKPSPEKPYICMRTLDEVMKYTGVKEEDRFTALSDYPYPGIWKLKAGLPVNIIVPPGYIINYYSFEGIYVNY